MIEIESLTRGFGDQVVLRDLSLHVEPGERLALVGPNGAGKSTLLRCILGTLLPDSGIITIAGHVAGSLAARTLVGTSLSQERSFYMRLTGRENLLLYARLRGLGKRPAGVRVSEVVEELALGPIAARRADRCSTGQLQQLALARSLLGNPSVILLDESTRSLDSDARGRLWDALGRRPVAAVLIASHLDEDVARATGVVRLEVLDARAGETEREPG